MRAQGPKSPIVSAGLCRGRGTSGWRSPRTGSRIQTTLGSAGFEDPAAFGWMEDAVEARCDVAECRDGDDDQ